MNRYGKLGFPDYYYHYKQKNDIEKFISYENKPDGGVRFYARDYVDKRKLYSQGQVTLIRGEQLTIITPAMLDFEVNDIILSLKDKKQWRIDAIQITDDNTNKQFSARPKKLTILTLVGD